MFLVNQVFIVLSDSAMKLCAVPKEVWKSTSGGSFAAMEPLRMIPFKSVQSSTVVKQCADDDMELLQLVLENNEKIVLEVGSK